MDEHPFLGLLETDLRLLAAEARKTDSLGQQISALFTESKTPSIKEATEKAVLKLKTLSKDQIGVDAAKNSKEILQPFVLACEHKNARVVSIALSTIQKLLGHNAINSVGRASVIKGLHQAERVNDDGVKLKLLQVSLLLLQDQAYKDDEEGAGFILGLCFRIQSSNRTVASVNSTAVATVRQAVALVFDHAIVPVTQPPADAIPGRVLAAMNLLKDLCAMCLGTGPAWIKCERAPVPARSFVLDLLDFVLAHRPQPFLQLPHFQELLRERVCPLLEALMRGVLDPEVDASALHEHRLVVRCASSVLRKYVGLAVFECVFLLELFKRGARHEYMAWQRIMMLQAMRQLFTDRLLVYKLFELYDMRIDVDMNAVQEIIKCMQDIVKSFVKLALEIPDDDIIGALASMYLQKANGKPVAQDMIADLDSLGPAIPGSEIFIVYLALDSLLLLVAEVEALTDVITTVPEVDHPPTPGAALSAPSTPSGARPLTKDDVSTATCLNMVDALWRTLLSALSSLLTRANQEALVLALLKGFQSFTYSAGALGAVPARDGFLATLCEYTLMSPEEPGSTGGTAANTAEGAGSWLMRSRLPTLFNTLAIEGREGLVLTPKNVQALRTLFNIAHRLADVLGPSWIFVVDVLNCLDLVLHNPHTTTLEAEQGGAKAAAAAAASTPEPPSDLAILATAANQLFQSTRDMPAEAVVSLLSALSEVSSKTVPTQATMVAPPMNALNRMVDCMLFNLHRISELWGIFLSHVLDLLKTGQTQVRAAAVESLDKTIIGSIGMLASPEAAAEAAAADAAGAAASIAAGVLPADSTRGLKRQVSQSQAVEHMMLVALDSLYREDRDLDVRLGVLRIVLHVLQRHGEHLTRGWAPLLRLLEAVPTYEESSTVGLAFQNVELLCSDFLSTIPKETMARALEVVALFSCQKAMMNVSLTAIGLLWNTTDFLSKCWAASASAAGTVSVSPSISFNSRGSNPNLDTAGLSPSPSAASNLNLGISNEMAALNRRTDLSETECADLMLGVFKSLRNISMDPRPEVRNSGVRTLLLAVGSHGAKFSDSVWRKCLLDLVMPLVKYIAHLSETSSAEEAAAAELGKERGKVVTMLVHHSRNTEQKLWDETLVLGLGGLSKVLRSYLPVVAGLEGFDSGWEELVELVGRALGSSRKSISMAATGFLTTLLQAHAQAPCMKKWMWKKALGALDQGVRSMATPASTTQLQARLELVNGIAIVYSSLREVLEVEDVIQLLSWLKAFALHPLAADELSHTPTVLPGVHKAVLQWIPALAPVVHLRTWPAIVGVLCDFMDPSRPGACNSSSVPGDPLASRRASNSSASSSTGNASPAANGSQRKSLDMGSPAGASSTPPKGSTPLWRAKVVEQLVLLYRDHAPWQVRASQFSVIVSALASCMSTRYSDSSSSLWRVAAGAFNTVVNTGLPAVNIAYVNQEHVPDDTWPVLTSAFEMFLLGPAAVGEDPAAAAAVPSALSTTDGTAVAPEDAEVQATVLDTLTDAVLTACSHAPTDMRQRLVAVVDAGCARSQHDETSVPSSSRFSHMCIRKLYSLCSRGGDGAGTNRSQLEIAQIALPVMLSRCEKLLRSYVREEQLRELEQSSEARTMPAVRVDEMVCLLDVLGQMTLDSAVVDAVMAATPAVLAWIEVLRASPQHSRQERERSHLLLLYSPLVDCVTCKDSRIRERLKDILQSLGSELGLVPPAAVP